ARVLCTLVEVVLADALVAEPASRPRQVRQSAAGSRLLRRLERVLGADLLLAHALALVLGARRRLGHDDVAVLGAGDGAADQDAVLLLEDPEDLEVLHGDGLVAHVTRHALALVDALRGEAAADGAAVA